MCRLPLNNKHRLLRRRGEREQLYVPNTCLTARPSPAGKTLLLMRLSLRNQAASGQTRRRFRTFRSVMTSRVMLTRQVRIWMQGELSAVSFTHVALIMHTDMLLLDSDLGFQKLGGNVQHSVVIMVQLHFQEISWDDSHAHCLTRFSLLMNYSEFVMCIFQDQRGPLH